MKSGSKDPLKVQKKSLDNEYIIFGLTEVMSCIFSVKPESSFWQATRTFAQSWRMFEPRSFNIKTVCCHRRKL